MSSCVRSWPSMSCLVLLVWLCSTVSGCARLCSTLFSHVLPCSAMLSHDRLWRVVSDCTRLCLTLFSHFPPCSAILGHDRPCPAMSGHAELCPAVLGRVRLNTTRVAVMAVSPCVYSRILGHQVVTLWPAPRTAVSDVYWGRSRLGREALARTHRAHVCVCLRKEGGVSYSGCWQGAR